MTGTETKSGDTNPDGTGYGEYPDGVSIVLAAKDDSERYYFRHPTGGIASTPATDAAQASRVLADKTRGFGLSDFEQVDGFDADSWDYPDPVDSDREVNEHDIWMLKVAMRKGNRVGLSGRMSPRKNPTEFTIEALLEEWDSPSEIPLHDREQLQQADGVGPHRAAQVVGAAVANRLIEQPLRTAEDRRPEQ